jgi:hypothetical protein
MSRSNLLQRLKTLPIHPLFFVVFPALSLMGNNIHEVEPSFLWRPLVVLFFVALSLLTVSSLLLRDWHRAAVFLSIVIFLFFIYGHANFYIKKIEVGGLVIGRHRHMLPVWVGLTILAGWWAFRSLHHPERLTPTLNIVSIFLLIYPAFQIVSYGVERERTERAALEAAQAQGASLPLGYAPDVYYIILDAYGRQDVLMDMFEFDNSQFIDSLEAKGFYVAECSLSNYAQTMLSLTSSLNFDYLDSLTSELSADTDRRAPLRALGQYSQARGFFDSQGYNTVSFATNFPVSEWQDADYFLMPPPKGMSDFELMLSQTSAWRIPMDMADESPEKRSAEWYRTRTLFALEQMEEVVPEIPSPKFVFTHLVIPHHPFVFGPNGEALEYETSGVPEFPEYSAKYPDQVTYINQRIEAIVDLILQTSENPPIIVIQGDHGPAPFDVPERRMKILNAYYFPDNHEGLYSTITPVNTFRLILDKYFLQNVSLLEDRSLFSEYDIPYNYMEIPNDCQP